MLRKGILRLTLVFAGVGVLVPLLILALWGVAFAGAAPASQNLFRDLAVWFWPTSMAMMGEFAREALPLRYGAAMMVVILENAVLYAFLGLLLGNFVYRRRPRPQPASAEARAEPKALAAAASKGK